MCVCVYIYIYDISSLRVNDLTLILLTWRKWCALSDLSRRAATGRSPAEIVGSNPTGGMDICLLSVVCCQVEVSATS